MNEWTNNTKETRRKDSAIPKDILAMRESGPPRGSSVTHHPTFLPTCWFPPPDSSPSFGSNASEVPYRSKPIRATFADIDSRVLRLRAEELPGMEPSAGEECSSGCRAKGRNTRDRRTADRQTRIPRTEDLREIRQYILRDYLAEMKCIKWSRARFLN